jgi:hypothetical protein
VARSTFDTRYDAPILVHPAKLRLTTGQLWRRSRIKFVSIMPTGIRKPPKRKKVYGKRDRRQVSTSGTNDRSCRNLSGRRGLSDNTIGTEIAPAQDLAQVSSAAQACAANAQASIPPNDSADVESSVVNFHSDFCMLEKKSDSSTGKVAVIFTAAEYAAFCSYLKDATDSPATATTADSDEFTLGHLRVSSVTNNLEPLTFNRQKVDFSKVESFDLKFDAFHTKVEKGRTIPRNTPSAIRKFATVATGKITSAILNSARTDEERALALHRALIHPSIRKIAKAAGFQNENLKELSYHSQQIKEFIALASKTQLKEGRTNKDQSEVIDTVAAALSADVRVGDDGKIIHDTNAPSMRSTSRLYGLQRDKVKRGITNRKNLKVAKVTDGNARWWNILKRHHKGTRTIPSSIRDAVVDWVVKHENVIPSPIVSETLFVKLPGSTQKQRVTKLLLEIPVRELHNRMLSELPVARDDRGKAVVSDTTLRRILKENVPQLRRASLRHKEMCCCEVCQSVFSLQRSLNAFRRRQNHALLSDIRTHPQDSEEQAESRKLHDEYNKTFLQNSEPLHERPRHALNEIMCSPNQDVGLHHWKCVLRRCDKCPSYKIHDIESQDDHDAPTIRFHRYLNTTKCSIHGILPLRSKICTECEELPEGSKRGRIGTRSYLTLLKRTIGDFMNEYYLPALEEYAYHLSHVKILGTRVCGKMRDEWFCKLGRRSIRTIRDFAEALKMEFIKELQKEHFGGCVSLHIEGSSLRYFTEASPDVLEVIMETHSHFSDCSRQDARTVFQNMKTLIEYLQSDGKLQADSFMLDHTDGCSKQYRSGTAMYLLSVTAVAYGITIDRAVGAPGHGKDEVDGLNATDKRFLKELMAQTQTPEEDERDNRMSAAAMVEGNFTSIAEECARLCSAKSRAQGVKSDSKYKKREAAAVMKTRTYHVLKEEDIEFASLEMSFVRWTTEPRSSIGAMYNIRADPKLGVGKIAVRRIPCACDACQTQADECWDPNIEDPEDQPRYHLNKNCALWSIFEGLNNWNIVDCSKPVPKKKSDAEHERLIQDSHRIILEQRAVRTREKIVSANIGAISTDDPLTDGYYMIQWDGAPYETEAAITTLQGTMPPAVVFKGEWLCDAFYWYKVPRAKRWYTPSRARLTVRLRQVVAANVVMESPSQTNKLPNTCNKSIATRKGAKRLCETRHQEILSEIARTEVLDHLEDTDDLEIMSDDEENQEIRSDSDDDF